VEQKLGQKSVFSMGNMNMQAGNNHEMEEKLKEEIREVREEVEKQTKTVKFDLQREIASINAVLPEKADLKEVEVL
jgi:hypothetical protein